jgi:CheY-like chemotaxis protein
MPRILIVDDEEDLRMLISLILKKAGHETFMAEDGEDLFKKLLGVQPDLILLDVMMPGMETPEILNKLHETPTNPPVILITVLRYFESEREYIFSCGHVVEYLTKPFDVPKLLGAIDKHLNHGHDHLKGRTIIA